MDELKDQALWYKIVGVTLAIIVAGTMIIGISSVVNALDIALNPSLIKPPPVVTFNLNLARQLQLAK